jgi:hypothetical protein
MDPEYRVVYIGNGSLDAEEIRIFLEASGIRAYVNQESIGMSSYSVAVGPIGQARVLVPVEQYPEAMELIEKMQEGDLETDEDLSKGETVEDEGDD